MSNNSTSDDLQAPDVGTRNIEYAFAYLLIIVQVAGIVGNSLTILTVVRNYELRKDLNNVFLVNMAVCDLMLACLVLPPYTDWYIKRQWTRGSVVCILVFFVDAGLQGISNYAVAALALSRYIYISYPFHFIRIMKPASICGAIAAIWVVPVVTLVAVGPKASDENCNVHPDRTAYAIFIILCEALPFTVLVTSSVAVLGVALRHWRRLSAVDGTAPTSAPGSRKNLKALRCILAVVLTFVLLQGPWTIGAVTNLACQCVDPFILMDVLPFVFYLRCGVNPLVYFFSEARYRKALFAMFHLWKVMPLTHHFVTTPICLLCLIWVS